MKKLLCFPGQGSQSVGMGKLFYDNFLVARDVFLEVDNALNYKLSDIIFNGTIEELTKTSNTQPALMAVSIAMIRALEEEGRIDIKDFDYSIGHSLGEYTALTATGAFNLTDSAKLLKIRGESMQNAVQIGVGSMAAIIGADEQEINEIVNAASKEGVCEIANDNAPGQVVVSGHLAAIEKSIELAKLIGKKAIKLPVSAPFHCSLMKPVTKIMEEALEGTLINKPIIPVICNVTSEPTDDPEEIRKNLAKQVEGKVRFVESIRNAEKLLITQAVEIGPGKVLSGLIKRISANIITDNIDDKILIS